MAAETIFMGLDIGSTTVKGIALNEDGDIVFGRYTRHLSEVRDCAAALLGEVKELFPGAAWHLVLTGSGAISLSSELGLPFVQEVIASGICIQKTIPHADVIIELGGEDAKLTFLTGGLDQRMNETCAGGTGAFIDQMASFVGTDAAGLDALALSHTTIYPIASRCGVFSKTDVLPLLNEGAPREDIAASIMQAVVNQTVSGLARGREIKGTAVFLGGPLAFLQSLRDRFKATLKSVTEAVFPENAHYFVALGAALHAKDTLPGLNGSRLVPDQMIRRLHQAGAAGKSAHLPPLFEDEAARQDFFRRHDVHPDLCRPLETASGNAWLGFDSGSTTIKAVLIDDDGKLLHTFYGPNQGDPLSAAVGILKDIYARKPEGLVIRAATATGYGSALLTAGLRMDMDEVETVAHFTASRFFEPRVSFVLDIGGQDIKCMRIQGGAISHIQLNEACSAGCGSFIENFATSLEMPLDRFVEAALFAEDPVDLGTRCTVFMNSKVKQAQKEGISVGDIAAGLSYAVVRNACFKVMKINDVSLLGDHVVAQGGAFANDALLRALENVLGRPVVRPAFPGLMGAFGAALIARTKGPAGSVTQLLGPAEIEAFSCTTTTARCRHCTNSCLLTITHFPDKRRFISGNRCERGGETISQDLPNLYAFKHKRLFDPYVPLADEKAWRGRIGIPRTLNIYENYPLWFTLLSALGFRVELSRPSSKELFFLGYETIPSQTVCYPAKLAHGHVLDLIQRGIKHIFFPCLPREQKNFTTQTGTYNCPVVIGYPELLANNISALAENGVAFTHPFLPLDRTVLARRMREVPLFSGISLDELEKAVQAGFEEMDRFRDDIHRAGTKALETLRQTGMPGIVLAGHPYHVDPEVHHGIAELITSCGMAVLTEDAVAHLMPDPGPLRVVDQWTYHSRLYRAGAYAAETDHLAVLQLVSFGCGLDAVTADQLEEIVTVRGRLYGQIKIDEGANLGPARIRIRSLLAALRERMEKAPHPVPDVTYMPPPVFTQEMRKTHTILIPQMSPIHFQFLETVFATEGYRTVLLPTVDQAAIDLGLRYVNNDACFPAIVVVGQLLQAVHSGAFDPQTIALMISQTGGGCRATNYIGFLRKALHDCGMAHIPIVSVTTNIDGATPGFKPTGRLLRRAIMAGYYGDALMRVLNRVVPYEAEPGSAARLAEKWVERGKQNITSGSMWRFNLNMLDMIKDFDRLPLATEKRRPRVGLVGEILLKYHPDANNYAARVVEQEGGEAVMTDLMDFILYCFYDHVFNYRHLAGSWKASASAVIGIFFLEFSRWAMRLGFWRSKRFTPPITFNELRKKARNLISLGHQTGEGWLLAAEMAKLLESGVSTILCMQPFGCLPNHITGKGLLKTLKDRHPEANIIALDYDPGASEANQINRIKLMMSMAK
ncbi:2-hydroxyacyl-CoA dehydratase [Desulfosarcina sp. OttesenSCG-928-A07]|nr:2-hydroxyacyl-CoA dehydratase [Desulfosarcina sp. OttesenSCG-928-G17]MDL2329363.1 2-hydroxyacyl-CoA dehydratase [Desulfosarcina sp. OttesenSCG-928-A07]